MKIPRWGTFLYHKLRDQMLDLSSNNSDIGCSLCVREPRPSTPINCYDIDILLQKYDTSDVQKCTKSSYQSLLLKCWQGSKDWNKGQQSYILSAKENIINKTVNINFRIMNHYLCKQFMCHFYNPGTPVVLQESMNQNFSRLAGIHIWASNTSHAI